MTTRTLTALFDSHAEAERGRAQLAQIGIPPGTIEIIDDGASTQVQPTAETHGIWEKFKQLLIPSSDRTEYEEGVRRGGSLLTAPVDEPLADRAIAALEECHPIDIEQRSAEWRAAGWSGAMYANPGMPSADVSAAEDTSSTLRATRADGGDREEVIPVAEEQLRVGKREIDRGGVRVRAYVVEEPIEQSVRLRDEHVDVERRPVTGARATGDGARGDLLKERSIEMREKAEEPVVQKEMRTKEEVVVRKRAEEREQPIRETVRRTQVDIDKNPQGVSSREAGVSGTDKGRDTRR